MTIIEMHKLCDIILDKNNAPWFIPSEKDQFIQLAELEFVKQKFEVFEVNEKGNKDLLTLVRKKTDNNTLSIDLDAVTDLMYIVQVVGDFVDGCNSDTTHTEPIVPVQLDDEAELKKDPFYRLDDDNPGYIETYENGIRELLIQSSSIPTEVRTRYIKKPRLVFNDVNNPANNVDSELPVHVHEEIVNIATRKMLGSIQDQYQYQVQQNEESQT
ncbi:MAG: hypothetical protein ACTSU7_00970 [Candidatus Heimdallarchaeaceae archaeon]